MNLIITSLTHVCEAFRLKHKITQLPKTILSWQEFGQGGSEGQSTASIFCDKKVRLVWVW